MALWLVEGSKGASVPLHFVVTSRQSYSTPDSLYTIIGLVKHHNCLNETQAFQQIKLHGAICKPCGLINNYTLAQCVLCSIG